LPFFESRIQQCVRDFFCPIQKGTYLLYHQKPQKKGNPLGSLKKQLLMVQLDSR